MAASPGVRASVSLLALGAAALLSSPPAQAQDERLEADEYAWRLTRHTRERYAADLDGIRERGVLRVLTRNNSVSYFISRGQERGFEFELASRFAESLGVRVAFVVPERRGALLSALFAGEGDIIAAGTSVTPARGEKVAFTEPYIDVRRVIATRRKIDAPLQSLGDLPSHRIHLSFRSTTLQDMRQVERTIGRRLDLVDVQDGAEMERMMERVADGTYDATVVDDVLLGLEQQAGLRLVERIQVGDPRPKAWAVHPAAPQLLEAANAFLTNNKRLVAIMRGRYFKLSKTARRARTDAYRADETGKISPYDNIFRKVARSHGIDWRLLAAVAYTESRFDPKAKSRFGATGIMQLLPATAQRVGVTKLFDPYQNILAGARYLERLMKVFGDDGVEPRQQIRFALAAYNCGLGHVMDARELARRIGKDPNKWFNEVEDAMRLKENPKWHRQTRYGYARSRETIAYVSRIQSQFDVFARHVPLEAPAPPKRVAKKKTKKK